MSDLRDDLLPSLQAISDYTGEPVRRLRHLIAFHGFPSKQVGAKHTGRKSWCDSYYAEPDRKPTSGNGGQS